MVMGVTPGPLGLCFIGSTSWVSVLRLSCVEVSVLLDLGSTVGRCGCSGTWGFHLFSEGGEEQGEDSSLVLYGFTDRIGNGLELAKGKARLQISWV